MIEELKEHKSLVIALVVALLLAASGIMFLQRGSSTSVKLDKEKEKTGEKMGEVVKGVLSVEPIDGRQIYELGNDVVVSLVGDSDGKDAVGFDAALKVNQEILVFSQVESKLPSFETFDNVSAERVYIGGIRRLNSTNASIFDKVSLAELTFKARAEGHSKIDFIFKPGDTTESNIVLTTSKDGLGDVKGTDIYVGKKIALQPGVAFSVPNSDLTIKLKDVTVESAQVDISLGYSAEPKKFIWGEGKFSKNVESFSSYVFQAEKGIGNNVVLYYATAKSLN